MDTPPHGTSTSEHSADNETAARALPAGTIVADRYRIEALLGEGGMGAVYRAEHVHMRKQVAVKVLHADMSSTDEIVARFEREAVAAGNIAHPNVAAATDFGKLADGSFFLVLEYIDGKSLRRVLTEETRVPPDRALQIVQQIAAALGAAHAKGVVHRDLKPENVMLVARPGDSDLVKVLDFGIAKVDVEAVGSSPHGGASAAPLTRVGAVFGTPDYMSPEQAVGQAADGRSDLYSIGVMLYEMLTGERPYRGGTVSVLRQHVLNDVPTLPVEIANQVDARIGPLLHDLLAKTPETRVASAQELQERVTELLATPGPPGAVVTIGPRTPPLGTLPTSLAAQGLAASAPTAMALEGSPAIPAVVLASTARTAPSTTGVSPRVLAMVAAASLLAGLVGVGGWLALRGPSHAVAGAPAPEPSTSTSDEGVDPGVTLPPPPGAHASAAADSATGAKTSPRTEGPGTVSSPAQRPPSTTSAASRAKGRTKEKEGRKTGPGGIYIPPPKDWF